jgi:hypothetical protein
MSPALLIAHTVVCLGMLREQEQGVNQPEVSSV